MKKKRGQRMTTLATSCLILAVAVAPTHLSYASQVDDVCGGDLSKAPPLKSQYCKAAKDAEKASKTNGTLWKVYAGATAICTTACVSSMVSKITGADYACIGSSAAAGVADGVMTKDFMTAAMGVASAGGALALKQGWVKIPGINTATETAAKAATDTTAQNISAFKNTQTGTVSEAGINNANQAAGNTAEGAAKESGTDWGSCLSAAVSAYTTYSKKQAADKAKKTMEENLANAKALNTNSSSTTMVATSGGSSQKYAGNLGTASAGESGTSTGTTTETAAAKTEDPACTAANADPSNAQAAIQCAANSDPTSNVFANPNFARDLEKTSGMPAGDYLKNAENTSPSGAILAGMGNALTPSSAGTMAAALSDMEKKFAGDGDSGVYAGGGGGGGGGRGADNTADMMAGILSQFMPKKEEDKKNAGELDFEAKRRKLASASPDDPSISIFERVGFRYLALTPRMMLPMRQPIATKN